MIHWTQFNPIFLGDINFGSSQSFQGDKNSTRDPQSPETGEDQNQENNNSGKDQNNCLSKLLTCVKEATHYMRERNSISW